MSRELKKLQKKSMRKIEEAKQICKANNETVGICVDEIVKSQEAFDKWFFENAFNPDAPSLIL